MGNKKIKIEIPLEYVIDIASFGESGTLNRMVQISFEKEIKRLGYEKELQEARDEKMDRIFGNLSRTLGASNMKKLEDAIETGREAIKVANRLTNKN